MPKKDNLNDDSLMRIIFWYEYSIGSCFYDSVLFCLKNQNGKILYRNMKMV